MVPFSPSYRPSKIPVIFSVLLIVSFISASINSSKAAPRCFESIISFGDSLADTGYLLPDLPMDKVPAARSPYGRTFFHRPTGRSCDGRLIIDFIAESLGLPYVQPYDCGRNGNFSSGRFGKGVNFAVGGATALDGRFFKERGITPATVSLKDQLVWFKQFLATVPDARKYLQRSLFLVGEIGGNDYNDPLLQGKSIEETWLYVPRVIKRIGSTIEELIKLGAQTMLVPGDVPLGCLPVYLTEFESSDKTDYDQRTGCINWPNELSKFHNRLLLKELNRIRKLYPHVTIIYADYYNAAMRFYLSPNEFGFTKGNVLRACCGAGGPYNYNKSATCGIAKAACCDDPSSFASWDGIHYTEAAYKLIAQDCRKFLERSLVVLVIGGNDYNYPLTQGKSIQETKSFVPKVINKIGITIEEMIKLGVRTMLVAGNFPIGCMPIYLTNFMTSDTKDYDSKTGCINWLNEFSQYHNQLLRNELNRIQKLHPDVTIIYADYYSSALRFYLSPNEFGFTREVLRACCGGGGSYNFNSSAMCALPSASCCDDPSSFASWDGIHFTEAVYNLIAQGLLEGPYTIPHLSTICTPTSRPRGFYEY